MLKITTRQDANAITLVLEGSISGPWLNELLRQFESARNQPRAIHLDLTAVSFIDRQGARQLEDLRRQGVRITSASHFAALMLQLR